MSKHANTSWRWAWLGLVGLPACGHDIAEDAGAAGSSGMQGASQAGGRSATNAGGDRGSEVAHAGAGGGASGAGMGAAAGRGGSNGTAGRGGTGPAAGRGGAGGAAGRGGSNAGSSGTRGMAGAAGAAQGGAGAGGTNANPGANMIVDATIVVGAGQSFDGGGKRFIAGAALGDGSQSESQKPVFRLEAGAKLSHVVLGSPAADGIHCYGDATLQDIVWEDIGEDALTIKASGTVTLDGGSATAGSDKVFQINAASTFKVSNFRASHAGKFIRQNGGTTFRVDVVIDACDIAVMDEAIFRTDSSTSTVKMTNTRYSMIGEQLFMGVAAANVSSTNNTEY